MDPRERANAVRTETLRRVAILSVKMLAYGVGPALLASYGALALLVRGWQTTLLLASVPVLWASWFVAWRLARQARLERAVPLACFSVLGFVSGPIFLLEGTSLPVAVAGMGATLFGGLFQRRLLYLGFAATVAMLVLSDVAHAFGLVPMASLGPAVRLVYTASQTLVVLPAIGLIMAFALDSQRLPFRHLEKVAKAQASTLETVVGLADHVGRLVGELRGVSAQLEKDAREQDAISSLVSQGMQELGHALQEEAGGAGAIRENGLRIQERSAASRDRVAEVEAQLESLGKLMQDVRMSTDALSRQADNTSEIVHAIREVNDRLLLLALNAGLEANRAGAGGRGFAVIAGELRELTDGVGATVGVGFEKLVALREEASRTIERSERSLEQVRERVIELRAVSAAQRSLSDNFAAAAERIGAVAGLAEEQLGRVADVSQAMQLLQSTTSAVAGAAGELMGEVGRIEEAQRILARMSDRFREGEAA